jgi:hypothetical protein
LKDDAKFQRPMLSFPDHFSSTSDKHGHTHAPSHTTPPSTDADSQGESAIYTTSISDGRKISTGEILNCPNEKWKPNVRRVQSWNREDRKRSYLMCEMTGGTIGREAGFTERKGVIGQD